MNDGSAMPKGAASAETDAGPCPSAPTIESRVGSASAPKTPERRAFG